MLSVENSDGSIHRHVVNREYCISNVGPQADVTQYIKFVTFVCPLNQFNTKRFCSILPDPLI